MTITSQKTLPAMSLAVVGAAHLNRDRSNRKFEILLCEPGEPVELRPEPKNRHDERAVAAYSRRGVQIGYLTAERCGRIGQLISQGREVRAVFQTPTPFGAWVRVAFDGEDPQVDTEGHQVPVEDGVQEQDFWPDPLWPD